MKPSNLKAMWATLSLAACVIIGQKAQARYETCYEQEYRCETRYEQQCHTERECSVVTGRPDCHQEQVCTSTPATPQECREQNVCDIAPDGQHTCHKEQVCRPGSPGGQSCHSEQRCEPGQPERVCHDEYKCEQVPRQDCHYENVAKQCWVNDPVPTPPPQPPYQPPHQDPPPYQPPHQDPPPYYPPNPPPHEDPPYYPPDEPSEPPYYPPTPGEPSEPTPDIPEEMGEDTVSGVRLKIYEDLTAVVVFKDEGQSEDYRTEYSIWVMNEDGERVIQQKVKSNGKVDQKLILSDTLTLDQDYTLSLEITRKGGVLDQKYTFRKKFFRPGPKD